MIPNREGWHYLTVKKLSILLRGIRSKRHGDFGSLNCLPSFATEKQFENKDFRNVIMPSEDTKILEFNQYPKYDKVPFVI